MVKNAKAWKDAHPGVEVKVQFNYSPKVAVIAAISEAIKNHFVSCNEHGLEMLKAMWPWDDRTEPTVLMCRTALELLEEL